MTCRYAHKRVALLFTAVQSTTAARVINWPQKLTSTTEHRNRVPASNKPQQEMTYASK